MRRIVEAIVRDERAILPVSALLDGQYGVNGICMGVPCVVGKNGIEEILEIPLNEEEKNRLTQSASTLHSTLNNLRLTITV